jgi:hypothetical protein
MNINTTSSLNYPSALNLIALKPAVCFATVLSLLLFAIPKGSAQGVFSHWINKTGGSAPESALGAATDIGTNAYVLGRFYNYTDQIGPVLLTNWLNVSNLFLAKFTGNSASVPPWARTAVTEYPIANAKLVADASGADILVAGSFGGTNLNFSGNILTNLATSNDHSGDVFIVNYNASGVFAWLMHLGGSGDDTFGDMAIDPTFPSSSGFYLTGSFQSTNFAAGGATLTRQNTNGPDCFTAKFNLSGSLLWLRQGTYAAGNAIAVDVSNNCYVAGNVLGAATFDGLNPSNQITSSFLAKYDKTGSILWVRGDVSIGNRLCADKSQNIYTAGTFSNVLNFGSITLSNNSPATIYVGKCDTNGTPLWVQQISGWGYDGVSGMTIDSAGNCWVAGYFATTNQTGPPVNSIAVILCFDTFGNIVSAAPLASSGASMASSVAGAGNSFNGNICISGGFTTNLLINGKYGVTNLNGRADIFASVGGVSPSLKLTASSTNIICSWPSVNSKFTLQVMTNLSSPSWTTVSSGSSVSNQMVVTNSISGNVQFFRLINNNP